jgi:DNA-binding transcriptional MocR family regulator
MALSPLLPQSQNNLYEQVADRLETAIAEGTLGPGDRLPSVRQLHRQLSVSISTVLEAYRLLEDRGLIQARPQSGYYVKATALASPPEPTPYAPPDQASRVDNSPAFKLMQAVRRPGAIKLGAAVPASELLPLKALNRLMGQVLRDNSALAHSYDVPPGCEPLRQAVARRLMDAGCAIAPDQIVTTNGTFEAVYLSLLAVTEPGDTVAIESPTYYGLLEAFESLRLNALELPTHPRDGLSLEHLETALQRGQVQACALVSNFSNPLGSCMDDAKKQQLAALMARYDRPLIEDDVYGELHFGPRRPKAVKAFDRQGIVLYCSSYSKTLSPGLRAGWVVPGRYQTQVEQLKWVINQTTAIAPQLTIAAFLASGGYDRHLRRLRRAYQEQMAKMTQAICQYFPLQTRLTRPEGGHVLWVELPPEIDSLLLQRVALDQGISIAPGVIFSPSRSYQNCLRINTSNPWCEEIDQAMATLGQLIHQQRSLP